MDRALAGHMTYRVLTLNIKRQCLVNGRMTKSEAWVPDLSFLQSSVLLICQQVLETAMSTLPGRDHTSSSTPSLDGRGGAVLASNDGKSTKRTGPNYGTPYPESSPPRFNGLIHSCSILPSIHQTRRIRIKLSSLPQRPFRWSHSIEGFCPSS